MDPLSLTAGIIAVVGAGGAFVKGLKKLYGLKEAREEVKNVENEVSRLEKILHQTAAAYQAPRSIIANSLEGGLVEALTLGKSTVLELDFLIHNKLLKPPNKKGKIKVDRFAWTRKKKTVQRLEQTLSCVRADIADRLTTLVLCSSQRQELELHAFRTVFDNFLQSVEKSWQEQQKQGMSVDQVLLEVQELRALMHPPTSIPPTLQTQDVSLLRRRKVHAIMPEPGILFQPRAPTGTATRSRQDRIDCESVVPVSWAVDKSEVLIGLPRVGNTQLDEPANGLGIKMRGGPEPIEVVVNAHRRSKSFAPQPSSSPSVVSGRLDTGEIIRAPKLKALRKRPYPTPPDPSNNSSSPAGFQNAETLSQKHMKNLHQKEQGIVELLKSVQIHVDENAELLLDTLSAMRIDTKAIEGEILANNKISSKAFRVISQSLCQTKTEILDPLPSKKQIRNKNVSQGCGVSIQPYSSNACSPWCSCLCHQRSLIKTPRSLENVIGRLSIGYKGFLSSRCTESRCKRNTRSTTRLRYNFPPWFLARAIALVLSKSTGGSHMLLRTPRVLNANARVFQYARQGDVIAMQKLFETRTGSPSDIDPKSWSALHYAVQYYQVEMAKFLLAAGADPSVENENYKSASDIAWDSIFSNDCSQTIQDSWRQIFDFAELESRQFSVLHKTILGLVQLDLRTLLQASIGTVDQRDTHGRTPLSWAAQRGDVEALRILLDYGAYVDAPDDFGQTPLHHGVHRRGPEIGHHLLLFGADPYHRDSTGNTPMHVLAAFQSDPEVVRIFEFIAVDMSVRNAEEATPLLVAAKHNNTALFPVLLELSEPDIQDNLGYTAFHYAIMNNNNQMIIALLKEGARYTIAGVQNDTILHIAARYGETTTLEVLRKSNLQGLDCNTMDTLGKTAMDIADERLKASHEWIDAFNLLIGSIWEYSNRFEELSDTYEEGEAYDFHDALEYLEDDCSVLASSQQDVEQPTRVETQSIPTLQDSSSTSFENESLADLCGKVRLRPTHKRDFILRSQTKLSIFASIDAMLAI